jgi:hypothetical protein
MIAAEQMTSLEALLRRASQIAERQFNKWGVLDAFWLVETAGGKQEIIVSQIPDNPQGKDALADTMRELFRANGVQRYAVAFECWTCPSDKPASEAIVLIAEGGDDACMSFRDIIRTSNGALLGKLGPINRPTYASGRFFGLLNVRQHSNTIT